jgi:hypothetical protein
MVRGSGVFFFLNCNMYVPIKNIFRKVQAETRRREEFQVRECQVACWYYRDTYVFLCSKDMAFDHGGERNR